MWNAGNTSGVESLVIDGNNSHILQNYWDNGEFDKIFNSPTHWTRVTVKNGGKFDKDLVLRSVMLNAFTPDVFPALYQVDEKDSFFLVRNCSMFVRRLCLTGLKVPFATSPKNHFKLSVTTNYLPFTLEPLNVCRQINIAFSNRYNRMKKTLDLTNFSEDECLKEIFFHLNIPQCMQYILELIKKQLNALHTLVLQHNDLRSLESLDLRTNTLLELDLRHNKITWEGFEKLQIKRGMKLNMVWLDGNPLCINLSESDYIKRIDTVIPNVTKVDGIDVSNVFLGYSSIKNFVYLGSWASFVDHFLYHYFLLMEGPNRHQLARMYHAKSKFTLSVSHDPDESGARSYSWSKLSNYLSHSRNLLTLSDLTKAYSTLKTGPDEIIGVLNSLPVMQFDPNSFTVDVPISQDGMVMIDVGGIFQEMHSALFYFHRTFLLSPFKKNPGEWKIETDMLTISPATPEQISKSFTKVRRPPSPTMQLKLNSNIKDQDALIPSVCELTKLTKEYALRFLEESAWDLERTLQAFIDQLKANQIPMHAFSI